MKNEIRRKTGRSYRRCAFSGYRPQKMPFGFNESDPRCVEFKARLREAIEGLIGEGYAHFISGGALGMDMYAAVAVLELRRRYPWIILEMVSPFDAQSAKWDSPCRKRHARLFAQADMVTVISHEYTRSCMFARNRYLVNNADLLLAAWDGQPGGTAMTVQYARSLDIPVRIILPAASVPAEHACGA